VSLGSLDDLAPISAQVLKLKPSLFDYINKDALETVHKLNPTQLTSALDVSDAAVHLFIEFNETKTAARAKSLKALARIVQSADGYITSAKETDEQQSIWKLRQSVITIVLQPDGPKRAVPVADNLVVPPANLASFLKEAKAVFSSISSAGPMWGQAGKGIVHCFTHLDLAQVGDRQRFFKLTESLFNTAMQESGSLSASGEGRVVAPYVSQFYGLEFEALMIKLKNIFDPHKILNTGAKSLSMNEVIAMIRTDYNQAHRHDHLPIN
jgi:D-lactate dehydrogenase